MLLRLIPCAVFLVSLQAQVITTVAGVTKTFPPGGVPALTGEMRADGVAIDTAGNLFIADSIDNLVLRVSTDGILTVFAGNGFNGFSGDGGPATSAELSGPSNVAVDTAGNVYIADSANQRIREVSNGIITTLAGNGTPGYSGDGGPASSAKLYNPYGVAVDLAGNVYIADTTNSRIRQVSNGVITTIAGNGKGGYSGDGGPATSAQIGAYGVAVDSAGNVYLVGAVVREVSHGIITTVAGNGTTGYSGDGGPATDAQLWNPFGIAVDSVGNLYIADTASNRIREVSNGIITTIAGNGIYSPYASNYSGDGGPATTAQLNLPRGIAVDSSGHVYIADTYNYRVRELSAGVITTLVGNGLLSYSGDGGPAVSAGLNDPGGLVFDGAGNIYVADDLNYRVREITNGVISTIAGNGTFAYGGDGGPATAAELAPTAIAVDASGNVYISDNYNCVVRKISHGIIATVAGTGTQGYTGDGGPAISAELSGPEGVVLDSAGNLYIADSNNSVIRMVSNGVITRIAGTGGRGYSGDGGAATAATLASPGGIAMDSAGSLYIADTGNNRVRKVAGGIITTIAGGGSAYPGDGGPATNAELFSPAGVTVDAAGNVYISDTGSNRVLRVSSGVITTIAGNGAAGNTGDGGLATSAELNHPAGLAPDSAGNVYFADTGNSRVRVVLAAPPSYRVSPAALSFSGASNGITPPAQSVTLTPAVPGAAFTVVTNANWLSVDTSSGIMPATLQVTANPAGLSAGTYTGVVTISAPNNSPVTNTINVTFTVAAANPPQLGASAAALTFSTTQGAASTTQSFQILDTGGGSLPFTITVTSAGGSWLSLSAQSGTATPSSPVTLTAIAAPGSLPPGTYTGAITVSAAGSATTIPVTLSVSPASGALLVSQSGLTFNAVAQGGAPLPQLFGILNTGRGSLNWNASTTTLSGGNWLSLSPSSGSVQQPFLSVSTVNVNVNHTGLAPGIYYGNVQISSSGAANSPQSVTVVLNVLPQGTGLGPQIYPSGLVFTGVAGTNPSSQTVMLGNTGSASNSYLSSTIGPVQFLPTTATIPPSQPQSLVVQPDFTNLVPGITRGTIALEFSDGSPAQTINILMSAAPAAASTSEDRPGKLGARTSSCPPAALNALFRSPRPALGFVATVGQPLTLEASVSDSCGNLIVPGSQEPHVLLFFGNGDPQQSMAYVGNGVWQTSWRPVNAEAAVSVTLDATALAGTSVVGGQASLHGAVIQPQTGGGAPIVTAQGVVHAASDGGGLPIAPGELITVYGANLASGAGSASSSLPLPVLSNGTQVLLGGQPLPILYTSSGQVNVQVPYTAPVNTTFQISVQNGTSLSVPQALTVAQASPGIFTTNERGFGQGEIVRSDGVTLAQPGAPASVGEEIVIYCTGLGATTPAVPAGQAAPSLPASQTVNAVTATIGGVTAKVLFSGLTPGSTGLYQVNAVVPGGIPTGDTVPVTITAAGLTSQAGVTMAVH